MTHSKTIKKTAAILFLVLALVVCTFTEGSGSFPFTTVTAKAAKKSDTQEIRGVWIAYLDYKDAGLYDKNEKTFTKNADAYFKKLKNNGINTVFFHVVSYDDAIYPSAFLPWSTYMFKPGTDPDYDPLEILIDTAHEYDIAFHAWINPYRKTKTSIYDPSKKATTNRIVKIVQEIIETYYVDGIHFDDYFYPSRHKGNQFYDVPVSKRKSIINKMIARVHSTIELYNEEYEESIQFGISPAGNISYAESLGCDLKAWMSNDFYIDYIVPQIYWSNQYIIGGKETKLFNDRLDQWMALNKNDTPMYVGLALYRSGTKSSVDLGWSKKSDNIVTQIKQLEKKGCEGFVLFRSAFLYTKATQKEVENYRAYICP